MFRVFYHAPCPDGAVAAFAASLYLERKGLDPLDGAQASWHPMKVFLPPEEQFESSVLGADDEVFLLDYSGTVEFARTLAARTHTVTILDHHLTAVSAFGLARRSGSLPPNLQVELDIQRSGATIALDYFACRLHREGLDSLLGAVAGAPAMLLNAVTAVAIVGIVGAPHTPGSPREDGEALLAQDGAAAPSESEGAPSCAVAAEEEEPAEAHDQGPRSSKRRRRKPPKKGGRGAGCARPAPKSSPATAAAGSAAPPPILFDGAAAGGGYAALLGEGPVASRLLRLVRLIEDADLYRWWMQDSREFHAGLGALRLNYDVRVNPGLFAALRGLDLGLLAASGRAALEGDGRRIEQEMGRTFVVAVPEVGVRCLGVRTAWPELRSALGHALAERSAREGLGPMGIVAYTTAELERRGYIKVSVRGLEGADTLVLSEKFGGGGHRAASSCNVMKFVFDSWCEGP